MQHTTNETLLCGTFCKMQKQRLEPKLIKIMIFYLCRRYLFRNEQRAQRCAKHTHYGNERKKVLNVQMK